MARKRVDPTRARLLADVLAAPEDDAPRLVLADWLQERGDPLGELISIQCVHADDDDAVDRVEALLYEHGDRFREGLGPRTLRYTFERGFVEEVAGPTQVLAEALARIKARAPLRRVRVTNAARPSLLAPLLTARIEGLVLQVAPRSDFEPAFAESALLQQLVELHLPHFTEYLLAKPMPRLRELHVKNAPEWDGAEFRSLSAPLETLGVSSLPRTVWHFARTLRRLSVAYFDLDDDLGLDLPALEAIDVQALEGVTPRTLDAWSRARLPIRSLNAAGKLSPATCEAFFRSPSLDLVESLDLSYCDLEARALGHLVARPWPALRRLVLRGSSTSPLDAHAVATLLRSPLAACLRHLDLDRNPLGDEVATVLSSVALPELRSLHLRECRLGSHGATVLAAAETLPRLRELDLSDNPIGEEGALAFAATALPRLTRLALHEVSTGSRATRALKARFGNGIEKERR